MSSVTLGQPNKPPQPPRVDLESLFRLKYGDPETTGWGPRLRHSFGYFTPDDHYEATIAALVRKGCRWLDVGSGRSLFPSNAQLARTLADRCGILVGLDPDDTLDANPYVHERVKSTLEEFDSISSFDLATLRMVAEHIAEPASAVSALARLVRRGGKVVIYTVNQWTPMALASWLVPLRLHLPVNRLLWGTKQRDTFPVTYRMNTRRRLAGLFKTHGFRESSFAYLDDCRTFHRFRQLHRLELRFWRLLRSLGLRYPETCLLGVYERQ
jgi:SAM-dependent methyltransferase